MGMFDSLYVPCPSCGKGVEFQSKEADCAMDVWRSVDDAPTAVLWDVMNEPTYCSACGYWMALVDPAHPPGPPPRPALQAVSVRSPDNPKIHTHDGRIRWWPYESEPFSFADIIVNNIAITPDKASRLPSSEAGDGE